MNAIVHSSADTAARPLSHFSAVVKLGDAVLRRIVHPIGNASPEEIVAAMKRDAGFRDLDVFHGTLTEMVGGNRIPLADYSCPTDDESPELGQLTEVTAHFKDESSERIVL